MVVCTLCSCYPWPVLGLPPVWYKSAPYRSRAVSEPRGVLAEFGVTLREDIEIRVWDSTAEVRYLVVPSARRGPRLDEEALAGLVTRDAMIGTGGAVNGAHDMGGMQGFGPVVPEPDEPWFHAEWEKRVFAMVIALGAGGKWNIDASRFARENRPPAEYLGRTLLRDLAGGPRAAARAARVSRRSGCAAGGGGGRRWPGRSRGARERAARALRGRRPRPHPQHPPAHPHPPPALRARQASAPSSAPRPHVFPDSNAHFTGEDPQWLYTVRFTARELWGTRRAQRGLVDALEPYLEPA